ncbi:MAG: hypothetical protein IJU27_02190 [Bacteroidales bacterium]|nr:hypothetical protein [Bacteroidales bacterium]
MEREDPLERLERQEREKQERKSAGAPKVIMFVLIAVAAALAVALAAVWMSKSKLIGELNEEKEDLTEQIVALQEDYATLSSDYEAINMQLDSSREEIAQLVDRIKNTEATNRAKMRQYEKELGTLRSIMRNYIVQIDSLNDLNHQLTVAAASARREAAESKARNKELTAQVEDLSGQVAAGSVVKARGIRLEAYGSNDRIVDRSTRVARLLVTLSLIENELAPKGPMRVYVRVTDPDGNLLQDGTNASFAFGDGQLPATASREVDYEGSEVEMSIYVNNIPSYVKGVYTVEVYSQNTRLGSAELLLR